MRISDWSSDVCSFRSALFSGTKQRVLGILYGQPDRSFYANELIGLAVSGSGAVQRELATLASSGLVTVKSVGNQKHYQANPEDRKRVVEGKSVSVRVDLGGRRIIKKKKDTQQT